MARRKQPRESANPHEEVTLSTNEKILRECYELYTSKDKGNCSLLQYSYAYKILQWHFY